LGTGVFYDTAADTRDAAFARFFSFVRDKLSAGWSFSDIHDLVNELKNPLEIGDLMSIGDELRVEDLAPPGGNGSHQDPPIATSELGGLSDTSGHVITNFAGASGHGIRADIAQANADPGSIDNALAGWQGVHGGRVKLFRHWMF